MNKAALNLIIVGAKMAHKYAAKEINYYELGKETGKEDVENMGFGSDILSLSAAFLDPYTLDPNSDDYEHNLLELARGYIEGSKMPSKSKDGSHRYGSAEGELAVLKRHIDWVKRQKELGNKLEPGKYYHP